MALAKFGSLFYVLHEYGIDVTTCIGPSMMPTFNQVGDVVVMERVTPNILKSYRRGDVVIATSPTNPAQTVTMKIEKIEWNVAIDDAVFSVKTPAGVR